MMDSQYLGSKPSEHGTAAAMTEQVGDNVALVKEAATDFGRRAVESVDAKRRPAAGTLEYTASALHQQADKVAGVAHATADKLQATADYVRGNDMKAMTKDVEALVRRYPGQALAAAVVLGMLVGRVVRTKT